MNRIVILCSNDSYQQQLRNVLSISGLRVVACKTLNECLEAHNQQTFDLTLMITDHQTTNHQILWFLEEMKINGNNSPLWAVTTQTSILDEYRVIRRDVVLLHPDDVTPDTLAEVLTTWRSTYEPLNISLFEILQKVDAIRLTGMLDVKVEGQSLSQLHFDSGNIVHATAPGLRGKSALNFLSTLEFAEFYLRDEATRTSRNGLSIQWRRTLSRPEKEDPRVATMLEKMLKNNFLCMGSIGQVRKWQPHKRAQQITPPTNKVVMREYELSNTPVKWMLTQNQLGDQSTDSFSEPEKRFEEMTGPTRPEVTEAPEAKPEIQVPPSKEDDRYTQLFREATLAYVRRDYKSAITLFEKCLVQRPNDPRAQHNLNQIKQRTQG